MLLHKSPTAPSSGATQRVKSADPEDVQWELGACWVQFLQNQYYVKAHDAAKVEPDVEGLGKGLLERIKKKAKDKSSKARHEVAAGNAANLTIIQMTLVAKRWKNWMKSRKLCGDSFFLKQHICV
nr:hypothetical protein [Tanacetum cinerariifolium]